MGDNPQKVIFALDIGTRSVIGLIGWREDDLLRIQYVDSEEYKTRAVVDGQIEDIGATAKIAGIVKQRLEEKLGGELHSVHIAAAGRVLRTTQASFAMELNENEAIDPQTVSDIELGAVQRAYELLFEDEENQNVAFYCVGHSVKNYTLDGYPISSLLDHRGRIAEAHIIATFLPKPVVESLYSTMGHIGLSVAGLTLEPIAAMNAIIPDDLRRLNLALVDIGAGTSDIAICDGGGIAGYTMATTAGDEITEMLMRECLVDFATAEDIKRRLSDSTLGVISYTDILGMPHEDEISALRSMIAPAVEELGSTISARILEAAGHAPAAVFLAGGGSQIPGLRELVAESLELDASRVAVGGANNMKRMIVSDLDVFGPEYATPTGIALTAIRQREGDTFVVTVNNEQIHLLSGWDASVLGVLQMAGCRYSDIMSHTGRALDFTVNGARRIVRGGLPAQSYVTLNGEPAALTAQVAPGDVLTFTPATEGVPAKATLSSVLGEWNTFEIMLEGEPFTAGTIVTVNGEPGEPDREIKTGDTIVTQDANTVGGFCKVIDLDMNEITVFVGEEEATAETVLQQGDALCLRGRQRDVVIKTHSENTQQLLEPIVLTPEDTALPEAPQEPEAPEVPEVPQEPKAPEVPKAPLGSVDRRLLHITLNGNPLTLGRKKDGTPWQFFDLLAYTDIDPQKPQGTIVQKRNGEDASYLEILQENDTIDIYWNRE